MLIEENGPFSIKRQCELLNISRSTWYYKPKGISQYNIQLMHILDEEYTKTPLYGVEKLTVVLRNMGHNVNVKRVRRLLRIMGIEAIYPKPNLSKVDKAHQVYPYLLRGAIRWKNCTNVNIEKEAWNV